MQALLEKIESHNREIREIIQRHGDETQIRLKLQGLESTRPPNISISDTTEARQRKAVGIGQYIRSIMLNESLSNLSHLKSSVQDYEEQYLLGTM